MTKRNNKKWRENWKARLDDDLMCFICGHETDEIHIHHGWRLCDGGPDALWNTIPVCVSCHTFVERLRFKGHKKVQKKSDESRDWKVLINEKLEKKVSHKTIQRWARFLHDEGAISPIKNGDGVLYKFRVEDIFKIIQFGNLVNSNGLSSHEAIRRIA